MYIENARIVDVIIGPKRYWVELELTLESQDDDLYIHTFNMATPIEDRDTLFDVVGVSSWGQLKNAPIRVVIPDYGHAHIIGNVTDNKWVDLEGFTLMYAQPELLTTEKERTRKKMKDLNKVIARPYRMTEIRKRFDKLDLVEIDTYLDQGEYFLSKESDEDCRQYIFNTIAREIAEIAYIEPPEYTPEKAKHFRDTMNKHLLLALQYNEY